MLKVAIVMRMTKIPFVSMLLFLCQMYNVREFHGKGTGVRLDHGRSTQTKQ